MIPDFQSLLLPILKITGDGNEHSMNGVTDKLAKNYNLSEEELNEFVPSGQQRIFANRVAWAKSYLKMAGLIELTKRSHFKITEKGIDILKQNLSSLNIKFLKQLPDFQISKTESRQPNNIEDKILETPEEQIANGYQKVRSALEQEILSKLKSVHPSFFERIVIELLVKMGYGGSIQDAGKAIGKTGD